LLLAIGMLLSVLGPGVQAADEARSRRSTPADSDARVHAALYKSLCDGRELFNSGKHAASAYFLEGAAASSLFMLEHRPELRKAVEAALEKATEETPGAERAKIVYFALLDVYDKTWPTLDEPAKQRATLWERMGGEEGATKIIDEFVERAMKNEKINFTRNGRYFQDPKQVEELKRKMVDLASDLGQGPRKYKGKRMGPAHEGMQITDAQFDELKAELHLVLLRNGVAEKDVLLILPALETTRRSIVTAQGAPRKARVDLEQTLWTAMGEEKGVRKIVSEIVDLAVKDKRVNFSRDGRYPMTPEKVQALKDSFFSLASAIATGKPYEGKSMLDIHRRMGITDAEFDAFVEDVATVLKDNMDNEKARRILLDLVETKRKDIVEKPRQGVHSGAKTRPDAIAGRGAELAEINELALVRSVLLWISEVPTRIVPMIAAAQQRVTALIMD
jgi:hemoglobin